MSRKFKFIKSKSVQANPEKYVAINVDCEKIIANWAVSIRSFEWLHPDGSIKPLEELTERDQGRRKAIEEAYHSGAEIEQPVLGIGMMDHVELGSGRAVFLTLHDLGETTLEVDIFKSNADDFEEFMV